MSSKHGVTATDNRSRNECLWKLVLVGTTVAILTMLATPLVNFTSTELFQLLAIEVAICVAIGFTIVVSSLPADKRRIIMITLIGIIALIALIDDLSRRLF